MFVLRVAGTYKAGMLDKASTLITTEIKRILEKSGYGELQGVRLLIPLDKENVIIGEYEFENLDQNERFWGSWNADPDSAGFVRQHEALLESEPPRERFTSIRLS